MSEFKKYPSIENSYQNKAIDYVLAKNPELKDCIYVIREKLDGANIQLLFTPNQPMKVGKRTTFLEPTDSFYDIWNTLKKYESDIQRIQNHVNKTASEFRFYGELYGQGIQKRVFYGPEKYISLFDCFVDDVPLNQFDFEDLTTELFIDHLMPPFIKYIGTLKEALKFNPEILSLSQFRRTGDIMEDNFAEGVVIQPYGRNVNTRFLLKIKGEKFKEIEKKPKLPKENKFSDEVMQINELFTTYVNINRVKSIFSKHGEIDSPKDIGKYIKLVLEDAKADFLKDHPEICTNLEKNDIKKVFNVGGIIPALLKEYL